MAHTNNWDETAPAGSDNPRQGDDEIRDFKKDIRERFATDHYMSSSDTKEAAIGEHVKVSLRVGSAPTQAADKILLYGKDVSTKCELFAIDEDGDEVQITAGGIIKRTAGQIAQIVNTQTGAVDTGTTLIPHDDTIPQITEGDEYMTLAITPKATTNKLLIQVTICVSHSAANAQIVAALFQDTTANALRCADQHEASATNLQTITFSHYMDAGTTSETTFRVRVGSNKAGTTTFNGVSAGRYFGGVLASSITITEITV